MCFLYETDGNHPYRYSFSLGKIISKTQLNDHLYNGETERDSNVIEVHINHLRRKLGKDLIETKRGQGYRLQKN